MFVSRLSGSPATPCCSTFDLHNEQQSGLVQGFFRGHLPWQPVPPQPPIDEQKVSEHCHMEGLLSPVHHAPLGIAKMDGYPTAGVYHFTSSLGSGESPDSTFDLVVPVARAGRFLPGSFLLSSSSSSPYIFTTRDSIEGSIPKSPEATGGLLLQLTCSTSVSPSDSDGGSFDTPFDLVVAAFTVFSSSSSCIKHQRSLRSHAHVQSTLRADLVSGARPFTLDPFTA